MQGDAVDKSDGLSVLGFLFDGTTTTLNAFLSNMQKATNSQGTFFVSQPGDSVTTTFNLSDLISVADLTQIYTYKGSLTTPPCYESVTWMLVKTPLPAKVTTNKGSLTCFGTNFFKIYSILLFYSLFPERTSGEDAPEHV